MSDLATSSIAVIVKNNDRLIQGEKSYKVPKAPCWDRGDLYVLVRFLTSEKSGIARISSPSLGCDQKLKLGTLWNFADSLQSEEADMTKCIAVLENIRSHKLGAA